MHLFKACLLKMKQTHEIISYLNGRADVLNISVHVYKLCLLKKSQRKLIKYISASCFARYSGLND